MCKNLILGHTHANITKAPLTRVSLFHKPVSLGIFLKMDIMGNSRLGLKLSMGRGRLFTSEKGALLAIIMKVPLPAGVLWMSSADPVETKRLPE